jgi:hypothetical protein
MVVAQRRRQSQYDGLVADGFAADGFQRGDATESGDKSFNMPLQLRSRKSLQQHRRISIKRTNRPPSAPKPGMDENERAAIRDEGHDPKVIAALERVRAELGDRTDLIHPFERRGPAGLRSRGFSRAAIPHRPLFWWSCRESNPQRDLRKCGLSCVRLRESTADSAKVPGNYAGVIGESNMSSLLAVVPTVFAGLALICEQSPGDRAKPPHWRPIAEPGVR